MRMISMITSIQNKQVKEWKKLHKKKYRYEKRQFLIEGFHLIEEAYETDQAVETIIVDEETDCPDWFDDDYVVRVTKQVFSELSQTETPQGILAVLRMQDVQTVKSNYVLLLDAIQDPGNLGTIIRTADAAGFSQVVLGDGTVDLYNDKVIRATQGSLFHIPIIQANLQEAIHQLKESGFSIWATTLKRAQNYRDIEASPKTAIILGNEGSGVAENHIDLADELVKIPIFGQAESLNVGIAAGILMYYIRN